MTETVAESGSPGRAAQADVARRLEGELREAGGEIDRVAAHVNVPARDRGKLVAFLHRHGTRRTPP